MIDVETTGLSPGLGNRVIEIGAVAIEKKSILDEFHSLINVRKRIPMSAQLVHGITDEMLIGKPGPSEVFPKFREFIRGSILVAHNAHFDISFLMHEFRLLGLTLENDFHCTLEMSRERYPRLRNHKLETVYRHVCARNRADATRCTQSHRALGDARMVAEIWMEMMRR
jgi:DNA polymerase-3 subunit epsilon